MKSQKLIFIDDSGNPGFGVGASAFLVMAAVVFSDTVTADEVNRKITSYREGLGWQQGTEFKFRKTNKRIIRELLQMLRGYDYEIFAVYVNKENFLPRIKGRGLYGWVIRQLLMEIGGAEDVKIRIDGKTTRKDEQKMRTYLRQGLNREGWRMDIKFEDSTRDNLVQLADLVAGAINRSLQEEKKDSGDYIRIFRKKIIRIRHIK